MRAYLALMRLDLKLAFRDRSVIFFNYLFPLIFFFAFAEMMGVRAGGVTNVVTMVLTIGILGNGLWGAGMRSVQEREMNILRRFKVTPISPAPILIASMVTGWLIYLPAVALICLIAHRMYGMPAPERPLSLFAIVTLGVFAFRAIGLILASIVNSTQESTIGIQILYMPMLFLSGATFPTVLLPRWAQIVSQFLPATYLVTGFQSVFVANESLAKSLPAVAALLLTMVLSVFISVQIFRWEKGEKLRPAAKLWVLAVLSPFVVMGAYEAHTNDQKKKSELLWRELMRNDTFLIHNAKIFVGSGKVIESGSVLVKDGRIAQVFADSAPDTRKLNADIIESAGKTLLPGLIDMHVRLQQDAGKNDGVLRELAAYLYCGVTAVVSFGDSPEQALAARGAIASGSRLGSEVFVYGGGNQSIVKTETVREVEKALDARASVIERGSLTEAIPESLFTRMAKAGVIYDPTLSVTYALSRTREEKLRLFNRSLVLQVGPRALIESDKRAVEQGSPNPDIPPEQFEMAKKNLLSAYRAGVTLVAGTDTGNRLMIHGPGVQQELSLWTQAGVPAPAALQGATYNAAKALRADGRFGTIEAGREANLLLVDGDPLSDISAAERISLVVFKGERIRRTALFDQK